MATNTLDVRLILKGDTKDNWANSKLPILKNELCIETDTRKMKIGEDGVKIYKELKYANITPEEVADLIAVTAHTHSNKTILDATTESFTVALKTKLDGIAEGANKTIVDSAMSSTSTNPVQNKVINSALDGKVPTSRTINGKALTANITLTATDVSAIAANLKGAANGVAELGPDGKIPASQLPSYVDDVLEGYLSGGKFYKEEAHTTEIPAESGKIYINLASGADNGKTYRWSGSTYVVISETIAIGETADTAYRGDRGKIAYEHSQTAHAPSNAERNIVVGIQKNGTDLTVDGTTRKVNISVPTKTSEITNDSGYLTSSGTIDKSNQLATARAIDGVNFNGTADINHYATCSTAAETVEKAVSITGFKLVAGARVIVKFTTTNTAASPTLNVASTGAKPIYYKNAAITASKLAANMTFEFVYNGTQYELVGELDTNTDQKVRNTLNTTAKAYITGTTSATTTTGEQVFDTGVYLDTTAGQLVATTFKGNLSGDVTGNLNGTATNATTAGTCTGNAGSATKLKDSRNFSITGGATAASIGFTGAANVALNVTKLDSDYLQNGANTLIFNCGTSV